MGESRLSLSPGSADGTDGHGRAAAALATMKPSPPAPLVMDPFFDSNASEPAVRSAKQALTLSAFLRFKWTIVLTSILSAGAAIPAIWLLMVPEYRGKATVEVLPAHPRVLYPTDDDPIPDHERYFAAQPSLIRDIGLLTRVLEQPQVQQTTWYQEPHKTLLGRTLSRVEALRDAVTVDTRPGTFLIDIGMRTRQRHDAVTLVDAIVKEYLATAHAKAEETKDAVYQRLLESRDALEAEIAHHKEVTSQLQRDLGASTSADVVPRAKSWLESLQAKLDDTRRQIATAEWQEQELRKLMTPESGTSPSSAPSAARYQDDAEWRRLHIELRTLQREIESNPRQLGNAHPDMLALQQKAQLAAELLKEQETRLDEQFRLYGGRPPGGASTASTPEAELAALRRSIGVLKKQEEQLLQDVQRHEDSYARNFDSAKALDRENETLHYAKREI
jgi:uncharacterized protein involved in exopolysaccharide biosynthesis